MKCSWSYPHCGDHVGTLLIDSVEGEESTVSPMHGSLGDVSASFTLTYTHKASIGDLERFLTGYCDTQRRFLHPITVAKTRFYQHYLVAGQIPGSNHSLLTTSTREAVVQFAVRQVPLPPLSRRYAALFGVPAARREEWRSRFRDRRPALSCSWAPVL